jgi:RNA polymerase sigma-70 factor (ECF subfamily)
MQPSMDEPDIANLIVCGAAAHPGIAEPASLRELFASCIAQGVTGLEARAPDLYLAGACSAGDPAALARLDADLATHLRPVFARLRIAATDHDELVQRVRVVLLVRDAAGGTGIARYTGRGDLRAYLRVIGMRIGLRWLEGQTATPHEDHDDFLALLPDDSDSAELALLKQRCLDVVRAGFASALASLRPRQRTLLRQRYVDGLGIDTLCQLHRVHRATCARWLDAARVKVVRGIRRHLRITLGLEGDELDTAIALVRSRLDLSLARQLASRDT